MSEEDTRVAVGVFAALGMLGAGVASLGSTGKHDDEPPAKVEPSRDRQIADALIETYYGRDAGFLCCNDLDHVVHGLIDDYPDHELPHSRVSAGWPMVGGADFNRATIRRYINYHLDQVTRCYDTRLRDDAGLTGSIVVHFSIATTGAVGSATGAGFDRELASCVASVIGGIVFPKPAELMQVELPLTFRPSATPVRDELAADAAWYMAGGPYFRPKRPFYVDQ